MSTFLKSIGTYLAGEAPKEQQEEEAEVSIDQYPPSDLVISDCNSCEKECEEHQQYPAYLDLDNESRLIGSMKPYNRHFLISTAQSDWPSRIEEDEGTLAANLHKLITENPVPWKTTITNTSLISNHSSQGHDIIILPENIIIANVTPDLAQLVYDVFVKLPLSDAFEMDSFKQTDIGPLEIYPNPYDSMILICSHRKRDKRCGITAPILNREFDHVLRELDVPDGEGGATVFMCSHVGGHKYAGNVICYINKGKTGIWYGRVKTCHCRAIIEETVLNGKVIKELYRGSMKYSFGDPEKTKCSRLKW